MSNTYKQKYKVFKEFRSNLEALNVDVNFYVDGTHLKHTLDRIIQQAQVMHEKVFKAYKLGKCPQLKKNQFVYSEIIQSIIAQFEKILFNQLSISLRREDDIDLISDEDFLPLITSHRIRELEGSIGSMKKKLRSAFGVNIEKPNDFLTKTDRGKDRYWSENNPRNFLLNKFVKFYIGGDPDWEKIANELNRQRVKTGNLNYQRRLEEYLKGLLSKSSSNREVEQDKIIAREFAELKSAFKDFGESDKSGTIISNTFEGSTNFRIIPQGKKLIKLDEKQVDVELALDSVDDLNKENKKTIFVFITNDSDYQRVFERVRNKEFQLMWMYGGEKNSRARKLKENVKDTHFFNLEQLCLGMSYDGIPETDWWLDNQLQPILDKKEGRHRMYYRDFPYQFNMHFLHEYPYNTYQVLESNISFEEVENYKWNYEPYNFIHADYWL